MDSLSYKTKFENKSTAQKEWILIDAEQKVLGRLASRIAYYIRGKHKPGFSPHVDMGANVIVINADKVKLTGNKWTDRIYMTYSGFPGGDKRVTPKQMMEKKPTAMVEKAVRGMLPKNRLGRALFNNLHVYAGSEHPHEAQQPKTINY